MRKRAALLAAGLLAAATITATPALAQPTNCTATDPTLAYVCRIVNSAPDPGYLVTYYYEKAGEVVYTVYCTAWPPC